MVWGAISASGTDDLLNIDGIMDKKVYLNIHVRLGVPSGSCLIGPGFIFKKTMTLNILLPVARTCARRNLLEH